MLASLLAQPEELRPWHCVSPTAVELARLMAAAPVAMSMVARELAECDVSPAAGLDSLVHVIAASSLVGQIVLAASSPRDDPQILHQIAAGTPALLPAVARALQRLLDSPYDLKPWFAGRDPSSTAADVGKACIALAAAASMLLIYVEAQSGGAMAAVQTAVPLLVPSLRHAVQQARPANAERATVVQDAFLNCVERVLRLLEAGQQAEAPPLSDPVLPPRAMQARAPALTGRAFAAASASTSIPQQQPCCGACGKTAADGARLRLCSGCRAARFCSDACYKAAWKAGHRQECKAAAAAAATAAAAARGRPGMQAK
ncbi:hypothetical protein MNEG_13578 [Monoraphidium neglectum]|uniref:MYND-type domain-containing protein n=1 Tax=Monoraphidium neglectum TaxID=145388 RepID=A0A0D2KEU1_9CHLO|nr:hypothetical protein MNEG_13578 [Monoraphidium neglectum]KIY94383.1 hypothetical protein MNEG_13578 [Monoraphidium neglectum]|eukprot:XP_013893403.1 hypothetical protein MNEG_13578 [Monoraphidium neglectum]